MKKIRAVIFTVTLLFVLSACSDSINNEMSLSNSNLVTEPLTEVPVESSTDKVTAVPEEQGEFQPVDISANGWNIIIEGTMRDTSIKNAALILGYTAVTTNEFVQEAPEGKEYFLIKMKITKEDSNDTIQWDKLTLTDSDGNAYSRIDDIFIEDLGMKRLPGTDLNFGSNEGWLAFEVEKGAEGLTLLYNFSKDTIQYTFD